MGKDSIRRLYIGHLPHGIHEKELVDICVQVGIGPSTITLAIKKGFGFIECRDQATADIAIERLNGLNVKGYSLIVEPANDKPVRGDIGNQVLPPRRHGQRQHPGGRRQFSTFGPVPPRLAFNVFYPYMNFGDHDETSYLYVPALAVGAIIGTKGLAIRHFIWTSGASIKVETPEEGRFLNDRRIVIHGPVNSHWKAQSLIYDKLTETIAYDAPLRVRMEMYVPDECVGRIIGKAGQRIKELQSFTGAKFKFLTVQETGERFMEGYTLLQIYGDFEALYHAQARVRFGIDKILNDLKQKENYQVHEKEGQEEKLDQYLPIVEEMPEPDATAEA